MQGKYIRFLLSKDIVKDMTRHKLERHIHIYIYSEIWKGAMPVYNAVVPSYTCTCMRPWIGLCKMGRYSGRFEMENGKVFNLCLMKQQKTE